MIQTLDYSSPVHYYYESKEGDDIILSMFFDKVKSDVSVVVYISMGDVPTPLAYDYTKVCRSHKASGQNLCTVLITNAKAGRYYYRIDLVYPKKYSIDFDINLQSGIICPDCQKGSCNRDTRECTCKTNWHGLKCNIFLQELKYSGTPLNFKFIAVNTWEYYKINLNRSVYLLTELNTTSGGAVDMYIQKGRPPTVLDYSIRVNSDDRYKKIQLTDNLPISGEYYVGIKSRNARSLYCLYIAWGDTCINDCLNGVCDFNTHTCKCDEGYFGTSCGLRRLSLDNISFIGSLKDYNWDYFSLKNNNLPMKILLSEQGEEYKGLLWLFGETDSPPTIQSNSYRNMTNTVMHSMIIPSSYDYKTIEIGVTTSEKEDVYETTHYRISAIEGCEVYDSCNECSLDMNCIWCVKGWSSSSGVCSSKSEMNEQKCSFVLENPNSCGIQKTKYYQIAMVVSSVIIFLTTVVVLAVFGIYNYKMKTNKEELIEDRMINSDRKSYQTFG
eukprot:TRINITY_DN4144_c0_g1_i1.p1 TRINITY_DN4144_c0_g1~~TRINITY_DN4144_c0_g1_i1.p1  ORF type:complete len:498 (-),score=68.07 TRINITY_DN4144_c0_g1_i1:52-1545(-)